MYCFYWVLNFDMLRYRKIKFYKEMPRESDMKGEYTGYNKLTGRALPFSFCLRFDQGKDS